MLRRHINLALLATLLASQGMAATITPDELGRTKRVDNADGSSIIYLYDANGNQLDRIIQHPVDLTVTVDPPGAGTVTGAGRLRRDTNASLSATPAGSFLFSGWFEAGTLVSSNPTYAFTVTAPRSLVAKFAMSAPEIVLEDTSTSPATDFTSGLSVLSFGSVPSQSTTSRTINLRNSGTANLTGISATLEGASAASFSKSSLPSSLAPGASATLTIQFTPSMIGSAEAALRIASNDSDENPFVLGLSATVVCPAITVTNPAATQSIVGTSIGRTFTQAGGIGTVSFALASGILPSGVTLSSSGVLAGTPSQAGSFSFAVRATDSMGCTGSGASYSMIVSNAGPDGSLDSSFGTDGKVTTSFGGNAMAFGVVLQPDGKAVAAGYAFNNGKNRFAVTRYNVDGSLDTTFNGSGKVITSVSSGEDEAHCLALQTDGKIVVGGFTRPANAEVALVRYNPDGSLDASFGTGGKVITPVAEGDDDARAITIQPDGKIVIAGYGYRSNGWNDVILLRYNSDGTLDSAFATGGKLMFDIGGAYDQAYGVALQPDGKIVAVGSSYNGSDRWAIVRVTPSGQLDSTFDGDGKVVTSFGSGNDNANSVEIQPDGKIVVGGDVQSIGNGDFGLARYNKDGSLDATFGTDGKLTTDWYGQLDVGKSLSLQQDGKMVLAGFARNTSGNFDMAIARYAMNGTLDASFGTAGKALIPIGTDDDRGHALAIFPYGSAVAAGYSFDGIKNNFAIARVNAHVTAPDVEIQNSTGYLVASNTAADLGATLLGTSKSASFRIENSGNADLSGITPAIQGVDSAMFSVSTMPPSNVPPNSSGTLVIRFAPTLEGLRSATLVLTSNDPDESPFNLTLSGRGIAVTAISSHPVGGVLSQGSSHHLSVTASGTGTLTYQWKLNGEALAETGSSLSLQNASFLNAGTYVVEVTGEGGRVESLPALVSIPLDSFSTWQSKVFSPAELAANDPAVIGPDARSGSGGIVNLLHYAMGNRSHERLPNDAFGMGADSVFRYNRLVGGGGLNYQVEFSRDLITWESSEGSLEQVGNTIPNPDGVTEKVGIRLNQTLRDELSKAFFRVNIRQANEVFSSASFFNYYDDADPGMGYPNPVWSQVPIPGRFEDSAQGVVFKASRPRGGGTILTKSLHVLAGRTVEFLWDGSGGSSFMQPVCGFTPNQWHSNWNQDNSFIVCDFGNVWNSWLASPGVIYKTTVNFTPTSATLITTNVSTGQEYDRKTRTGDFTQPLRPFFRGGDTHDYNGAFLRMKSVKILSP